MIALKLIKIALVGDHLIFRSGLRMLLETEENFKVTSEVTEIAELADLHEEAQPDVILVILTGEFKEAGSLPILPDAPFNEIPIIVLSGSKDPPIYERCLKSGIKGFMTQDISAVVLFKAIKKVCEGEYWFDRTLMGKTIQQLTRERKQFRESSRITLRSNLTERENQIIDLICEGLKNKQVAKKLFITEATVRHHLTSIFEKLNLTSRLELVVYAFNNQLVKIPAQPEINLDKDR